MHGKLRQGAPSRGRAARSAILWTLLALATAGFAGCIGGGGDEPAGPETPTGRVNGRVVEPQSGAPIQGATVTLTSIDGAKVVIAVSTSTTTDANGEFWFTDLQPGHYTLHVDASGIVVDPTNPDLAYVGFTTEVNVNGDTPSVVDASLPVVDTAENVPVNPGEPIVLTPADIPGLRIDIDADAVTFPDGGSSGELNVVQVGFNDGPAPLPHGFAPAMMIKIVPEGTRFDPPARITFPNRDDLPAGRSMELFSFDAEMHAWASDGGATTTVEGVAGDAGVGIDVASTHFVVCDAHTVSGRVSDAAGSGVIGAHVTVWARVAPFGEPDVEKLEEVEAMTGGDGSFSIPGVRACNVTFSAVLESSDAFGELEPGDTMQTDGSGTTDLGSRVMDVVTQTSFTLTGVVRRQDGSPISGASVQVFDPQGGGTAELPTTSTNTNGTYELSGIVADPGKELGVHAFEEATQLSGEAFFHVPPLSESGAVLTVDLTLCDEPGFVECGERGEWSLSGSTLTVVQFEVHCGEETSETQTIQVISLVDGVLTMEIVENEMPEQVSFSRVGGTGPSGVNASNMVGVYKADWDDAYLGLYADGTFTWLQGNPELGTLQSGTYTSTPTQITATFIESTDPSTPPGTYPFDYTLSGDVLTFVDPEGPNDTFGRCSHGPDNGIEGNWTNTSGGNFNLILYRGEFAGVGYDGP